MNAQTVLPAAVLAAAARAARRGGPWRVFLVPRQDDRPPRPGTAADLPRVAAPAMR
jgi:hypothetical protein